MKNTIKIHFALLLLLFTLAVSSCSVGNKDIPDPNGNISVDTSAAGFIITVRDTTDTKDSTYSVKILSDTSSIIGNRINNDTLEILGVDALTGTKHTVIFITYSSEPGSYPTDLTPVGINKAIFIYKTTINSVSQNYFMIHGNINITEKDTIAKVVKGNFDVNNKDADGVGKSVRSNFSLRYLD